MPAAQKPVTDILRTFETALSLCDFLAEPLAPFSADRYSILDYRWG